MVFLLVLDVLGNFGHFIGFMVFCLFERFQGYFSNLIFLGYFRHFRGFGGILVFLGSKGILFVWVIISVFLLRFRGILVISKVSRVCIFLRFQWYFGHFKSFGGGGGVLWSFYWFWGRFGHFLGVWDILDIGDAF